MGFGEFHRRQRKLIRDHPWWVLGSVGLYLAAASALLFEYPGWPFVGSLCFGAWIILFLLVRRRFDRSSN
jgi:hypothetical protein